VFDSDWPSEPPNAKALRRARMGGCYVIKAAESRPARVTPRSPRTPPAGYTPPVPSDEDRALVAALLAYKGRV